MNEKKRKILDKVKDVVELNDSFSILSLVNWGRSISFLDSWILLWKTSWLAFKKEFLPIFTSSNWGRSKYHRNNIKILERVKLDSFLNVSCIIPIDVREGRSYNNSYSTDFALKNKLTCMYEGIASNIYFFQ